MNWMYFRRSVLLFLPALFIQNSLAEWPIAGIEPVPPPAHIESYINIPDDSGGIWSIFDSVELPPTSETRMAELKGARDAQITQGYLRIQHIDSNGVKLFGDWGRSIFQDTTAIPAWLHGAVPTSDGGVIVAFVAGTSNIAPDGLPYLGIYGQRFDANGDPLWPKRGVPLAVRNGFDYAMSTAPYHTPNVCCTDGEDGMWLLAYVGFSMYVTITNVQSDGKLNPLYSIPLGLGNPSNIRYSNGVAICEDGRGGVFAGYMNDDNGSLEFQHLSQNKQIVSGIAIDDPENYAGVTATPDGYGGVYFMACSIGEDADIQRINSNNVPVLDPYSDGLLLGGKNVCEQPAILSNGDAVFMYSTTSDVHFARYDTSLFCLASSLVLEDVSTPTQNGPAVIAAQNGEDVIAMQRRAEYFNDQLIFYISMHRVPPAGSPDLWASPPRILVQSDISQDYTWKRFTRLSDGSLLAHYSYDTGLVRFHRISEDGPPVSDVSEQAQSTVLPTQFRIESAWPNPFNSSVTIRVQGLRVAPASLFVYDLVGRDVAKLNIPSSAVQSATVVWHPEKDVASGVYIVRATTATGSVSTSKIVFLR